MYLALPPSGHLEQYRGLPLIAKRNPEKLLESPKIGGQLKIWLPEQAPKAYEPKPNVIGTILLVACGLERQPYMGEILFTGWDGGVCELPPWVNAAITDMHTAIRIALTGVASGMGADFDAQTITTAKMAIGEGS